MNTARLLASTAIACAVAGCGANPSDICASDEAVTAISSEARQGYALFEEIRAVTEEPPFQSNETWKQQSSNLANLQKKSDSLATKLEEATATCISMEEGAATQADFEASSRAQAKGGDIMGAIAGFGVGVAVAIIKPQIDAMTPAQKRKDIWTPMCNGDFSAIREDHAWGTAIAAQIFPNRYAFWYNTVEKIREEKSKVDQVISDTEIAIAELEANLYSTDYEKVNFELRDASLISKNDDETSYKCSANVTGVLAGYSEASKNLNYDILITSEGKKKVSIVKDADYEALFAPFAGE